MAHFVDPRRSSSGWVRPALPIGPASLKPRRASSSSAKFSLQPMIDRFQSCASFRKRDNRAMHVHMHVNISIPWPDGVILYAYRKDDRQQSGRRHVSLSQGFDMRQNKNQAVNSGKLLHEALVGRSSTMNRQK